MVENRNICGREFFLTHFRQFERELSEKSSKTPYFLGVKFFGTQNVVPKMAYCANFALDK